MIEISFTWDDPAVAQKIVETWVNAYLEERARILGRKSLHTFYETERAKVAENIQSLKDQLQGRLKQIDSISVDARLKNLTNQIDRVTDAKVSAQNQISGIRSLLANASQQIKSQPADVVTMRETSLNPTQLDLKRQLNALQVERGSAVAHLPAGHPAGQPDRAEHPRHGSPQRPGSHPPGTLTEHRAQQPGDQRQTANDRRPIARAQTGRGNRELRQDPYRTARPA